MKDTSLFKYSIFCLFLVWISSSQSLPAIIRTSSGPIEGSLVKINGNEVYQFLGIPYAEPPLGDLRFRKPQPVQPWSETFKANKMPPACIQYAVYPFPWYDFEEGKSEDCLYLNIWVPETEDSNDDKTKKSVMFWIHGGGFVYGSIRMPVYNGQPLATEGDVIVVTTNYRLGAFGFFTTDADDNIRAVGNADPKFIAYDADHERRRKEQLIKLYDRTAEQVEEEQTLLNELRKIELRKKEREKKTQDLQKLITAADNSQSETKRLEKKGPKKKVIQQKNIKTDNTNVDTAGIKFADFKGSGVSFRSQRMKLPASVGQKKAKAIEQLLKELDIGPNPIPTEDVCTHFNELRSDMVLLYELKLALANCEFELQTLRHQTEAFTPEKAKENSEQISSIPLLSASEIKTEP